MGEIAGDPEDHQQIRAAAAVLSHPSPHLLVGGTWASVFHVCGRALTRLPLLPMLAVRAACHIPRMVSGHWPGRASAGAWAAWKASSASPGVSK
jgi:hypothetical protein